MAAIELARLGHRLTAIDNNEQFVEMLLARAKKERLSDDITALLGDMCCLEKIVGRNLFDVILPNGRNC